MINRKIIMFIGMVLLVAGVAYASGVVFFGGNAYEDSDDRLVLDIELNEDNYNSGTKTFADDSGEDNDGVSTNAATFTTDKYGKSTGAMSFDWGTDYVDLSSDIVFNITTENYTFSMWHYIPTGSGTEWKGFTGGVLGLGGYWMYHSGGKLGFYQDYYDSTLYWWMSDLNLGDEIPYDTWTHITVQSIVINYTHTNLTAYINGGQYYDSNVMLNSPRPITIFKFREIGRGDTTRYFNGSISQVKIWNRTLSAVEVGTLYNSSKPKASAGSRHKGLVGHWALDSDGYNSNTERITDKTPYENHGTNSGATLTTDRMGHSNKAMNFSGSSDYIDCGNDSSLNPGTNNFSVGMWVKVYDLSGNQGILTKEYTSAYGIYHTATNDKIALYIQSGSNHNGIVITSYYGQWIHVVWTVDNVNDLQKSYLNGVFDTQTSYTVGDVTSNYNLNLGRYTSTGSGYFNGSISDIRIYDRVLSADEIDTLYHSYRPKAASGSLQKGLVFDMPLKSKYTKDETVGSEIMTDRTPYSNDGQNYGATVGSSYTDFDGINDYINAGADSSFDGLTEVSISVWVNINNKTSFQDIVKKGISFSGALHPFALGIYNNKIYWDVGNSTLRDCSAYDFGNELDIGWHHIAVTYNGAGNKIIYIDGIIKLNLPSTLPSMKDDNQIRYISGGFRFNGSISSAKIYNRALSESEIKLLYDKGR